MTNQFKGTGVALATPVNEDGSLDLEGLERLVNHVIDGGVDYLVALGTTGESPTIRPNERKIIIDTIAKANNGKVPLVVGFSGNSTEDLVEKVAKFSHPEVDGLLIASPYYNKPSQEGIVRHYQAIADKSNYPIILYNVPHRTSSNMEASTTLRLAEHPKIIAIKEASCDLDQCREIISKKNSDFNLISGDDTITSELMKMGASGVISVVANAYPHQMWELVNGSESANSEALKQAIRLSSEQGNPSSIKVALESLGVCKRHVRLPLTPANDSLLDSFKALEISQ